MTRTETDLREALRDLERLADDQGAPPASTLVGRTDAPQLRAGVRRIPRWIPPTAAAAAVAAVAISVVATSSGGAPSAHLPAQPGGHHRTHNAPMPVTHPAHRARHRRAERRAAHGAEQTTTASGVLEDAAARLDAASWSAPDPQDFFYVRSTDVTTWTSVSGREHGFGRNSQGMTTSVPGCVDGHIVAEGESGSCTLNDVPHYLADAPTTPADWDAYLEHIAPGAKAGNAQGKIIVEVLHEDLVAPQAAAALLRYTETCPGLRTIAVRPVDSEQLVGVTCTSMTNGSYGLAFDAASHAFVGFVVVHADGSQDGPAEIIEQTGIVPAIGRTPARHRH